MTWWFGSLRFVIPNLFRDLGFGFRNLGFKTPPCGRGSLLFLTFYLTTNNEVCVLVPARSNDDRPSDEIWSVHHDDDHGSHNGNHDYIHGHSHSHNPRTKHSLKASSQSKPDFQGKSICYSYHHSLSLVFTPLQSPV